MLQPMATVRYSCVLAFLLATSLGAQSSPPSQVVISVVEASGTVVSGADVEIIRLPLASPNGDDWFDYARHATEQTSTHTDVSGKAAFALSKGNYAVVTSFAGFGSHFDKVEVREEPMQSFMVTIYPDFGGPVSVKVVCPELCGFPLESPSPNVFIPLETLQPISFVHHIHSRTGKN